LEDVKKGIMFSILALIIFFCGCTDEITETLKPDLAIQIIEREFRNETGEGYVPTSGSTWLFLSLNITNNNEEGSVPITAYHFFLINKEEEVWCRGFEGESEPSIDPGETIRFIIYFEVETTTVFDRLEYRRTLEDPIEINI
jgi:hypothetical protein